MPGQRTLGALLGAAILAAGATSARAADVAPTLAGPLQVGTYVDRVGGCSGPQRWLRDGDAIDRATQASYMLKAADLGHHITVRVTCTDSGGTVQATSSGVVTSTAPELPVIEWTQTPPLGGNLFYLAQSSVLGDPTDPGIGLNVGQLGADNATPVDPTELQIGVAVQSNGRDVVPIDAAGVEIIGSGNARRVVFHPQRQGVARLVFTVTGTTGKTASFGLDYFASTATTPTSRVLQMASDASTAIGVGDGYIMVADDERGPIGLYDENRSGAPLAYFNVGTGAGEVDFESSARNGDAVFWLGSHGNSKKGVIETSRHTVYESRLEGSGANATLTAVGSYANLRRDLLTWDQENGNRFGLVAAAAAGMAPDGVDRFTSRARSSRPTAASCTSGSGRRWRLACRAARR
ncbi:hypothetical protein [Conexibacter sp. CPCC 206217]|uniref:hypothetical protein n=1 Tax=Conexibacter sp. CPCC 206217 TaxID=3064574 RepID=UPI0027165866|nr:hypothetical protein [Conexibacter sp. CPCC 206217]MDO8211628.1 hypothetical protein [Conexibacter sp. CPCC 206217]